MPSCEEKCMKRTSMLILGSLLMSSTVYSAGLSFKKISKEFKKSKLITSSTLKESVLSKTFSCQKYFQDNSNDQTYVRFEQIDNQLVDVMNTHPYELSKVGLMGTRETINGPVSIEVKLKGSSLFIFDQSEYTPSFANCSLLKDTRVDVEAFSNQEIVSQATNGKYSWLLVNRSESGDWSLTFKSPISKVDISVEAIREFLHLNDEYKLGPGTKVEHLKNSFYIKASMVSDSPNGLNYIIELNDEGKMISSINAGEFYGSVSLSPEGEVGTIQSDYEAGIKGHFLIQNYNQSGEVTSEFKSEFGIRGIRLSQGYLFKSYCLGQMVGNEPCPQERHNYQGVVITNLEGNMTGFLNPYNHFGIYGQGFEPVWMKATQDGGFYVAWKADKSWTKSDVTLIKYSATGEYENSWGEDAPNKKNRNVIIPNNFDRDMMTIKSEKAYFTKKNVIFSFNL